MEAPTIVSLIDVIRQPVEQPVDIPVRAGSGTGERLQGFLPGQFSSSSVEQNVDFPVPHGRDRVGGGFLGVHPGQSSTAFGGAQHFPAATAEQIVDIPVPRGGRVLHPASSSSGLPGTANQGVFRTFPRGKKGAHIINAEVKPELQLNLRLLNGQSFCKLRHDTTSRLVVGLPAAWRAHCHSKRKSLSHRGRAVTKKERDVVRENKRKRGRCERQAEVPKEELRVSSLRLVPV